VFFVGVPLSAISFRNRFLFNLIDICSTYTWFSVGAVLTMDNTTQSTTHSSEIHIPWHANEATCAKLSHTSLKTQIRTKRFQVHLAGTSAPAATLEAVVCGCIAPRSKPYDDGRHADWRLRVGDAPVLPYPCACIGVLNSPRRGREGVVGGRGGNKGMDVLEGIERSPEGQQALLLSVNERTSKQQAVMFPNKNAHGHCLSKGKLRGGSLI
jgi:CDGSH-type Zn-finger protein